MVSGALVGCLALAGTVDIAAASARDEPHRAKVKPIATTVAAASQGQASRRAVACRHVRFVGVAGSGEQRKGGTYGDTIDALRKRLIARVGTQYVASDYVKYDPEPAEGPQLLDVLARGEGSAFISGFRRGVKELKALLRDRLKWCPDEILVPAGYSQGAMVVVQAMVELRAEKRWDILDRIAVIDLVASPFAHKEDPSILIGSAKADHRGIFNLVGRPARLGSEWIGWVYEACNSGDIVCDTGSNLKKQLDNGGVKKHEGYKKGDQPELEKLARFSANRIGWLPTDAVQPITVMEGQAWSGAALTGGANAADLVMTPQSGWPSGSSLSGGRISLPGLAPGTYTMTATLRHARVAPGAVRTLTVPVTVLPRTTPPPPPPPPPTPSPFVNITNGAQAGAPAISADGTKVAFRSSANTLTPGDSPSTEDVFVWNRLTGATTRVTGNVANWQVSDPSISGDGRYIAYVAAPTDPIMPAIPIAPAQVYVWDAQTGNTTQITSGNEAAWAPDISDDGSTLSFSSAASDLVADDDDGGWTDVFVWRRGTSGFTNLTSGPQGGWGGSVSGDGKHIYYCRNDGPYTYSGLVEWDRDTGQRFAFPTGQNGCGLPGVSTNGTRAAAEAAYGMWVIERQGDSFSWIPVPSSDDGTSAPAISGDGRILAFHSGQGAALSFVVRVWDSATNAVVTLPKSHATNPDLDRDGRFVVFTSSDGINLWTRP